ncbi:type I polyketide synthase [Streptomyces mirabilis]|uniref:type I polyketide synthase n=1 Tax=Streptomyces mirabilis TaxID=68239 RepID=UPI0036AFEA1A
MNTVEPIAIIGMGCRFPGAPGVEEFWKLLESNTDAVVPVPRDRFDVAAWYDPRPGTPDRLISRHGGFLDGVFDFDAAFFGISPREARTMDPQQRLLLHVVWEAFEDAGIPPSTVRGSGTGVFVGQATAEYGDATGPSATADVRAVAGSRLRAVTAGRVSHAFDLRGPSLVLDTACSSSLVALHSARQSLLTGECELAVAAGVNTILTPTDAVAYSQGRMLAPDGRCKFGDSSANGFVRSEGVGTVLLKRLSDALADGDPVHALLLGSAVTNDGDGSGLLLQPAVSGQVAMVRSAWRSAGVSGSQVDYVEAHGTGTTVGDGVELRALAEALGAEDNAGAPLLVGSVKTNIGHAEAAAGIAGLIKTVLVAKHRTVPASLHLTSPHPQLTEPGFPVTVADRNTPLRPRGDRAVLGVSSFGLSGTNAHAVIGEYVPEAAPRPDTDTPQSAKDAGPHLLVLSARTPTALRRLAARHAAHLGPDGAGRGHRLRDICRSAAMGRDAHPFRLWAVGHSHDALADVLRALAADEPTPDGGVHEAGFDGPREVAFVFSGQGSQWRGMGRELLRTSDAFRAALTECDAAVREELGWSVVDLLLDDSAELADAVERVQPALWAMEVALAAHWRGMGVEPDLVVGHSMGEAVAACVAGALSVRDAARVICRRSSLMQRLAGRGAMLATELSPAEAHELVAAYGDDVCVAVENSPSATVLAGDAVVLDKIAGELERRDVLCRRVKVNVASHSRLMDEIRDDLLARLADVEPAPPRTEMVSTVRCASVRGADLDAAYWVDNLRRPVRFAETVRQLAETRDVIFVEVSPHPLLAQAIDDVQSAAGVAPKVVTTLVRLQSEATATARAMGRAFSLGARVDWRRWYGDDKRRIPLPLYTWDAEDHRVESVPSTAPVRLYERQVRLSRLGVADLDTGVSVRGLCPVPPAVFLQAVAEAVRDLVGEGPVELLDTRIGDGLPLLSDAPRTTVRIRLDRSAGARDPLAGERKPPTGEGEFTFAVEVVSEGSGAPALCLAGTARAAATPVHAPGLAPLDGALTRCGEYVPGAEFYRRAEARGYSVAPALRTVRQVWRREGEAVARLHAPSGAVSGALEAGLLAVLGAWPHSTAVDDPTRAHLPLSFARVLLADAPGGEYWSTARSAPEADRDRTRCDVLLTAPDGRVLAEFEGIAMVRSPGRPDAAHHEPDAMTAATAPPPAALPPAERAPLPKPGAGRSHASRPPAERLFIHTATMLGTTVDRVDPRRSLRDLGLDSLMATQLRRILHRELGVDLPTSRLLGNESAAAIAADLREEAAPEPRSR